MKSLDEYAEKSPGRDMSCQICKLKPTMKEQINKVLNNQSMEPIVIARWLYNECGFHEVIIKSWRERILRHRDVCVKS